MKLSRILMIGALACLAFPAIADSVKNKVDFVTQIYSIPIGSRDIENVQFSKEIQSLEKRRDWINTRPGSLGLDCEAFPEIIPGNAGIEPDFFKHPVKVTALRNGRIRAEFFNVGEKQQVDLAVSCSKKFCQVDDVFYRGISYKNSLKQCR